MDPDSLENRAAAERLTQYRNNIIQHHAHTFPMPPLANSGSSYVEMGESSVGQHARQPPAPSHGHASEENAGMGWTQGLPAHDPMIYSGVYAPSGFDMMSILVRVAQRPEPKLKIGQVDGGVALIVCDSAQEDMPIVYCSEAFCKLTGYSQEEVLGRNCRFLQVAPGRILNGNAGNPFTLTAEEIYTNWELDKLRLKLRNKDEISVELVNYKKDGTKFINLLTVIPVSWDPNSTAESEYKRYIVGFQAEGRMFKIHDDTVNDPDVIDEELIYPELQSTADNTSVHTSPATSPNEQLLTPGASGASDYFSYT